MSNQPHSNLLVIGQNQHQQVRQNLLSNHSNQPQLQIHNFPQFQILHHPQIAVQLEQNIRHQLFVTILNYLHSRRTIIPDVPISRYKYISEILMFLACLVEMVFFKFTFVHAIWLLWYPVLGFHRHWIINRRIRFFGELIHFCLWIVTNCYIFSHHKGSFFAVIFLIANMDYYFIGYNLMTKYYWFFSYILWNCCADIRLKMILKRLNQRRKQLIQKRLTKFAQNEKTTQQQLQRLQQQSLQQSQNQSVSNMQKQIDSQQQQNDKNICLICLTSLNYHSDLGLKHQEILRLECSHRYHYGCLKSWMETANFNYCPVCRNVIME